MLGKVLRKKKDACGGWEWKLPAAFFTPRAKRSFREPFDATKTGMGVQRAPALWPPEALPPD
jgi:hypothetical protein